ncbi:MAG: hypothetical protein U0237_03755 [Thermoleophilia bacterium]
MTDIDLLIREFRADQPGPATAPAAVAASARAAKGPRRRHLRRRLLAGAGVTATVAGVAALLLVALPGGGDDRTADVPGGYAAVATLRISAPGGVTDALLAKVTGLIRRRAAAQGVAGVQVSRAGSDRLTLVIPRSAGWERVLALTEAPGIRVVDITGSEDITRAPVVVPPDRIGNVTYARGRLRVEVASRVDGGLPDALAQRRKLALVGTRNGTWTVLGMVDAPASEALSSEAILVRPQELGAARWAAKTYAGGGAGAVLTVEEVHTEGTPPANVIEVPKEILELIGSFSGSPVRPGRIARVIDGTLSGRRVTEWEGMAMDGTRPAVIEVDGTIRFGAGCAATEVVVALRVCGSGAGPGFEMVSGEVPDGRAVQVELRRDGTRYLALKADWRFVGLVPPGTGPITVVTLDASGTVLEQVPLGAVAPSTLPASAP